MVALSQNKQCFDCHQRGPTYVNMAIGSYVCTSCSGILRGLNPPHRVKSISMASFTPDEMEFLKCHGNDFCKKVWLGLYDPRSGQEYDSREEQKVKDFMVQKYERKRWHVSATDAMKDEARRLNESALNKQNTVKPLRSLLGENAPKLVVQNNFNNSKSQSLPNTSVSQPQQLPLVQNQTLAQQAQQSSKSQPTSTTSSATFDLLGDLGGDPFASTPPSSNASSGGGFADFSQFSSQASTPTGSNAFSPTSSAPLQPLGMTGPSCTVSNGGFAAFPQSSTAPALANTQPPSQSNDKYAALADLCNVFNDNTNGGNGNTTGTTASQSTWNISSNSSSTVPTSINWGGTGGGISTPVVTSGSGGFGFASVPTTSGAPIDWAGQTATAGPTNMNWGPPTGVAPPQSGFGNAVPNPFGTGVFAPAPGGVGGGNPFATAGTGTGGNGTNSIFGTQAPPNSNAGFNQFGLQNGNFNAMSPQTAGFGGMPPQTANTFGAPGPMDKFGGFAAVQSVQGFATGWGQNSTPSANPFMSAATQQQVPPRSSSTNPFL